MNDEEIVALFENRDENAIQELSRKYSHLCYKVAWNILGNREDCEECVNDTWFSVWSLIPPKKPSVLSAFTCRITRGHAIDCSRRKYADKRVDTHIEDVRGELDHLDIAVHNSVEENIELEELVSVINQFLWSLPKKERGIFLMRYWYMDSMKDIATYCGISCGSVKVILYRTRKKLLKVLKEERYL